MQPCGVGERLKTLPHLVQRLKTRKYVQDLWVKYHNIIVHIVWNSLVSSTQIIILQIYTASSGTSENP